MNNDPFWLTPALLTGSLARGTRSAYAADGWNMDHIEPEPELINLDALRESDSPRLNGESEDHIRALIECEDQLPPIIVHRDTMRIIDGMHRYRAAMRRGKTVIPVILVDIAESDNFASSVERNVRHGLPLSLADRKAAASRIINLRTDRSDRTVARITGLSHKTVGAIRRQAHVAGRQEPARVGADGRIRPIDQSAGRRRAHELLAENPEMPLRRVAESAGISPATVRDVRDRLSRGDSPTPQQQSASRHGEIPRPRGVPAETSRREPETVGPTHRLAGILDRLKSDPALRFNEAGRGLLRMLHLHLMADTDWERLAAHVPPHHAVSVAHAAQECASNWRDFANRLMSVGPQESEEVRGTG
ncbi:MAG: hypothetical protein GEU98_09195 [Pseudonocardiaceae bacterium]|nr:hypothetical protein [Pseudonocardiaceae bacterium]